MNIKFISRLAFAMCIAAPTTAATLNSVGAFNGSGGSPGCGSAPSQSISNSATSVTVSVNDGAINCTMFASAAAGGGYAAVRGTINGSTSGQIAAGAESTTTDIMLTPLFDVNDPDVPLNTDFNISVGVNMLATGSASGAVDATGFRNWRGAGGGILQGTVELSGLSSVNNHTSADAPFRISAGAAASFDVDADGAVLSQDLNPTITVDWRLPLRLSYRIGGDASINGFGLPNQTGTFDAFNTLSFSTTGAAFNIPGMFTVDVPELYIFNNSWVDPRVSVVPLPAGLPLLLAGLGALGLLRLSRAA